jgi:hypothetical protein
MPLHRGWARDIEQAEYEARLAAQTPAAVIVVPTPQLPGTVSEFVTAFLDQHEGKFVDGLAASRAAVQELVLRDAEIGRGVPERERFAVAVETVGAFNRRKQAACDHTATAAGQWLCWTCGFVFPRSGSEMPRRAVVG